MKLFSNPRARRNTALMVLFAWLFALASGVANACLLEARETHSHVVIAVSSGSAHAGTVADHGDDSQNFKAQCLKVCDDGSRSLPKQNATAAQPDPGPAPLLVVIWNAVAPAAATPHQLDEAQPPTPGLPIRVRYSRLAL